MRYVIGSYTSAQGPGLALASANELFAAPDGPEDPSWVVVSDDGIVYSVSEANPGQVSAWRPHEDGSWTPVGAPQPSGGSGPCHATLDASGEYLLVANYGSGTVAALPREASGALLPATSQVQLQGSGPVAGRQEASHAHQVVCDPRGRWLWVCDLGGDQVVALEFDAAVGKLTVSQSHPFPPGSGPRHLAFVGEKLVVAGELDAHAYLCTWDTDAGTLLIEGSVELSAASSIEDFPSAVVPSGDGRAVYIALRGSNTVVELDLENWQVHNRVPCGGDWPRAAIMDPARPDALLVANERAGGITRVDMSGAGLAQQIWRCEGASVIAVAPSHLHS